MKNMYNRISLTLKELRRQRGWSLDKAAENTGVSKAMPGQIEREESNCSFLINGRINTSPSRIIPSTIAIISAPKSQ